MEEKIKQEGRVVFTSWTNIEAKTGEGQIVSLSCRPDEIDEVKEFFRSKVCNVMSPETSKVKGKGGFHQYTRYDIYQHCYAGGSGYIEVLEIKNPPENSCGFIINEYKPYDRSFFTEWETVKDAEVAFNSLWGSCANDEVFPKMNGFKRLVYCNELTPWFYAVGEEEIIGDYAFPQGLQDDPVYRVGKKFVVYDQVNKISKIKTCMGARVFLSKDAQNPHRVSHHRFVYWDDGSMYDGSYCYSEHPPRPVKENEEWITKAIGDFYQLLSGEKTSFSVKFTNGDEFVGKIKPASKSPCAEGRYDLKVTIKGGEVLEGYVDFKPKPEAPDVVKAVIVNYEKKGIEVEKVEVVGSKVARGGKKWAGVYFLPAIEKS